MEGVKHGCKDSIYRVATKIDGFMSYGYWHGDILYPKYKCNKCGVEGIAPEIGSYNIMEDWLSFYKTSLIGYKSRNIKIAEECDVLYCIVPYNWDNFNMQPPYDDYSWCRHCKVWKHPTNGGCWTLKKAKKLGKETHLVVIE